MHPIRRISEDFRVRRRRNERDALRNAEKQFTGRPSNSGIRPAHGEEPRPTALRLLPCDGVEVIPKNLLFVRAV
jgi:hypothetical protein